jgi:hypothetical protein
MLRFRFDRARMSLSCIILRTRSLVLQPIFIGLGTAFPMAAASALLMAPSPE